MGYLEKKRNAMLNNISQSRPPLPSEYQEVEWIQSTGSQYLNLKYHLTIDTEYIVDGNFLSNGRFGVFAYQRFYFGVVNGQWACGVFEPSATYHHSLGAYDQNRHIFSMSKDGFLIDDVLKSTAGTSVEQSQLFAFALNYVYNPNYYVDAKVYNITLKEDGTKTMELIPCYRKSDNEIGMYDIVNDVFYTNQGTGTFLKGGDV